MTTFFFFFCFFFLFPLFCSSSSSAISTSLPVFREAPAFRNGPECPSPSLSLCSSPETVHVAMTLDSEYIRGSFAAVLSIVKHTLCPENVAFHFLASRSLQELSDLLRSTFPYLRFQVYRFDEALVSGRISSSVRKALEQPLNYARAYAAHILPSCVRRIIYLDSDVLVVDDIRKLWLTRLSGHAIAAPEYCHANFTHYFTDAFWADPALSDVFAVPSGEAEESEAEVSMLGVPEAEASASERKSADQDGEQKQWLRRTHLRGAVSLSPSLSTELAAADRRGQQKRKLAAAAADGTRRRLRRKPCYFNTGVMVMDMDMWRKSGYSQEIEKWMRVQRGGGEAAAGERRRIYELGSLPPFLLVFAGDVKAVEQRWNQHGLGGDNEKGDCRDLHPGPVSLLHWSGKGKPWIRLDSHNPCPLDVLWAPYDLQLRRNRPDASPQ